MIKGFVLPGYMQHSVAADHRPVARMERGGRGCTRRAHAAGVRGASSPGASPHGR